MWPKYNFQSANQHVLLISNDLIHSLLLDSSRWRDLSLCKKVHFAMVSEGLDSIPFLVDRLILSYGICGSLLDGNHIFSRVLAPDVNAWNAIISAHTKVGQHGMALSLFSQMQENNIQPDKSTFLCILKACGREIGSQLGRVVHDSIIRNGLEVHIIIQNTLVDMYCNCMSLEEARKIFDDLPERDGVAWCAMINGYAQHGSSVSALKMFEKMQQEQLKPNVVIFLSILKACANIGAMWQGKWVHDQVIRSELEAHLLVGSSLVDMYCKSGRLDEARCTFDTLPKQNVVSWGAMITGYADCGRCLLAFELFEDMKNLKLFPTRATFLAVLKVCTSLCANDKGKSIHHLIVRDGLELDEMVGSSLVDMYAKCGSLKEACKVFESLPRKDIVTWGAMIEGYVEHDEGSLALEFLERMQHHGIKPNKPIFLSSLKACGNIQAPCKGRLLHGSIVKSALESDTVIGTSLVDMYAKCGSLEEAHRVFDNLSKRTVVSWSAIIAGYAEHGCGSLAFELYEEMKAFGMTPDKVAFSCILKACISLGALQRGREVHEDIKRSGLQEDTVVGTSLVDMYSKCGSAEEARSVFDEMPKRNTLTWGAMISGYAQQGYGFPALELFEAMQEEGIKPNKVTFLCILKACGNIGAILHGRWIHAQIINQSLEADSVVGNAIMDMYARCGSLEESQRVFYLLKDPSVASWSSMITGYSQHGIYCVTEQHIDAMERQGLKPNNAIFASLLSACSHSGVTAEACQFFKGLREDHGLSPSFEHYSCMIDLFGRGGCFNEAEDLLKTMPALPNIVVQMSLLTHCQTFSYFKMGNHCVDEAAQESPSDASGYLMIPRMYADANDCRNVDHG